LLTNEAGEKIGKSAGNAVWLDGELTSPYHLYQYLLNRSDTEAATLLQRLAPVDVENHEIEVSFDAILPS